jgi:hypothetical protein
LRPDKFDDQWRCCNRALWIAQRMAREIVLVPQITIADLLCEIRLLDVRRFLAQTRHLVPYVPDVATSGETALVRALLAVPLPTGVPIDEWLEPYRRAGVEEPWLEFVVALRVRGHERASALAHEEAVGTAAYDIARRADVPLVVRSPLASVVRPASRTLGLRLTPGTGSWELARVREVREAPVSSLAIDALADAVAERIGPTVGGEQFLGSDRRGRALSVLAATVASALGHKAAWRWYGREKVVRADIYRRTFTALGLEEHFEDARRVFEVDHPHHVAVAAPWPPGDGTQVPDIGILGYRSGHLELLPQAHLPVLPDALGMVCERG